MLASTSSSQRDIRKLRAGFLSEWQPAEGMTADRSRLKTIDIEFMRRLHTKVNLIPVIAKADTLTDEEVALFKQRVS